MKSFHQALIENDNHPYLKKISNGKLVLNDYSVITGRRLDHAGVVAEFEKMIRVNKSIQTYSLNIYERATKQDLAT